MPHGQFESFVAAEFALLQEKIVSEYRTERGKSDSESSDAASDNSETCCVTAEAQKLLAISASSSETPTSALGEHGPSEPGFTSVVPTTNAKHSVDHTQIAIPSLQDSQPAYAFSHDISDTSPLPQQVQDPEGNLVSLAEVSEPERSMVSLPVASQPEGSTVSLVVGSQPESLFKKVDSQPERNRVSLWVESQPEAKRVSLGVAPQPSLGNAGTECKEERRQSGASVGSSRSQSRSPKRRYTRSQSVLPTWPLRTNEAWKVHDDSEDCILEDKKRLYQEGVRSPRDRPDILSGAKTCGAAHAAPTRSRTRGGSIVIFSTQIRSAIQVADPSSGKRLIWDFAGLFLVIYDIIFVPLTIFDLPSSAFFLSMQWLTLIYWGLDIVASFLVGYHERGSVELEIRKVAKHYLRTFFAMDILLIMIDIVGVLLTLLHNQSSLGVDPSGLARAMKSYRMLRILRALRLFRVAKLPKAMMNLAEHFNHESMTVTAAVVKLTCIILMLNHIVACLWYGICVWGGSSSSWAVQHEYGEGKAYLYTTALHWSLTQFTPSSMEVHPESLHERIFCLVVIMFGLVVSTSFVSSITNSMTHLRFLNSQHAERCQSLFRYLRHNNVSLNLSVRVRRHVSNQAKLRSQVVLEKDVFLLQWLSVSLHTDLHYEIFGPTFRMHVFFAKIDHLEYDDQRCMKRLCHETLVLRKLFDSDVVFSKGDRASTFYIVKNGMLKYSSQSLPEQVELNTGDFLAEAVLWAHWVYHGKARAECETDLMEVDSCKLQSIFLDHPVAARTASHYAALFVAHMNKHDPRSVSDVHDQTFDPEWASDVAAAETQMMIEGCRSDSETESVVSPGSDA